MGKKVEKYSIIFNTNEIDNRKGYPLLIKKTLQSFKIISK